MKRRDTASRRRRAFTLIELPVVRERERGAFTLIELLVVVAVIGILASLMMPTLSGAMRASTRATCSNHLKQIGACLHTYAVNYEGYLPNLQGTPGASNSLWVANKRLMFWADSMHMEPKIFICPAFHGGSGNDWRRHRDKSTWYTWPANSTKEACTHINLGYIHMGQRDYTTNFNYGPPNYVPDNIANCLKPSLTPYFLDFVMPTNEPMWAHVGSGGNQMFVDFHVDWVVVSHMRPHYTHTSWGDLYWKDPQSLDEPDPPPPPGS
ncbi:type II secretion system protein [Planctomycetota bacterium]